MFFNLCWLSTLLFSVCTAKYVARNNWALAYIGLMVIAGLALGAWLEPGMWQGLTRAGARYSGAYRMTVP